jgi:chaperonin cofactor prefoldin
MKLEMAYQVFTMLKTIEKYSDEIDDVNRVRRVVEQANKELIRPMTLTQFINDCEKEDEQLENKIENLYKEIEKL